MTSVPVPAARRVSVVEAAREAIDHTQRTLFPFRFERWLALGFLAFLEQCGRGGGVSSPPTHWPGNTSGGGPDLGGALGWLSEHAVVVALAAGLLLAVVVALTALALWIGSRGIFMYLDNVASGRVDVGRAWQEHADRAASLFAWRFTLAAGTLVGVLLFAVLVAAVVVGSAGQVRLAAGITLLVLVPFFLALVCFAALASVALRDFVAPLQLRLGLPCGDAIGVLWGLVRERKGTFLGYVGAKILFSMAAGSALLMACCVCCCAALPVVGQTLLQPLFYFERAWSLCLLRQLGYDLIAGTAAPAVDATGPLDPESE